MFPANTNILIIDDMATMRKIVTKACRDMGYSNFAEAADGNQAWQVLQSANPPIELVISDWNMPECSGLELLKRVRADNRFKKLPFLLLTAEAEVVQVSEALQAGVDNYIVKPFTKDVLQAKIAAVHKKRSVAS